MPKDRIFPDVDSFATALVQLRQQRREQVISGRNSRLPRSILTKSQRAAILGKTDRRCHLCGGLIRGGDWQADHVLAHSTDGKHSVDNYLPAHSICNNYRWHYGADEFQWILKLGVWMRTQIEKRTAIGQDAGAKFCEHEKRRSGRRKSR